jgi:hypothetical protein
MKRRVFPATLLLIVCMATRADLIACGDKFLVVSRNTRYKRASAPRTPAVILIYANPNSNLPRALANVPIDATLRKVGYKPTSVATAEDFDLALEQGSWDLIVVDEAEGQNVLGRLKSNVSTVVLPVFYNASKAELKQAKKQYPLVLESPTKSQAFLDTIDEALELKPRTPTAGAKTTG